MDEIFYITVCALAIICFANWRIGIYICLVVDVVRDPIRKLAPGNSVLVTLIGAILWLAMFLGALAQQQGQMFSAFRRYATLRRSVTLLVMALIPGALISLLMYRGGYQLVIIGSASYLGPLVGIGIGYLFPRTPRDITRLLVFYCILNALALLSVLVEFAGVESPVLGGINYNWIRYHGTTTVELISGIYRSPDIMGLHAAHVVAFGLILSFVTLGLRRIWWTFMAMHGGTALILSGRRKMLAIPLVFIAAYVLLSMWRGSRSASKKLISVVMIATLAGTIMLALREEQVAPEYQEYAATLLTEGFELGTSRVTGSVASTVQQIGFLGSGLGSATQGSQYANVSRGHVWQEDGISRLFKELGVLGVLMIAAAAYFLAATVHRAIVLIPPHMRLHDLQVGLVAVVIGNAASFIASHQQYSGDPMTALWVAFLLGAVIGIPRCLYGRPQSPLREQPQQVEAAAT